LIRHWSGIQPKTGSIISMPWKLCELCSSLISRSVLDLFCYILLLIWTDNFALQDDMQWTPCQKRPKLPICRIHFIQDNAALHHTVWAKSAPNQRTRSARKSSLFLYLVLCEFFYSYSSADSATIDRRVLICRWHSKCCHNCVLLLQYTTLLLHCNLSSKSCVGEGVDYVQYSADKDTLGHIICVHMLRSMSKVHINYI